MCVSLFRQASACLPVALLKEVDITGASYLILPRTLTKKSHSFLRLLLLGLCFQPACPVTAQAQVHRMSHSRYGGFDGEHEQRKVCRVDLL